MVRILSISICVLTFFATRPLMAGLVPTSGLVLWLDAQDIDDDGNPTNNPANGTPVGTIATPWVDKAPLQGVQSGSQSVSARQPTYLKSGQAGQAVVQFDAGNQDFLESPNVGLGTFTYFTAFRGLNDSSSYLIYERGINSNSYDGEYLATTTGATLNVRRTTRTAKEYVADWGRDGQFKLAEHSFDGTHAGHLLYVDGVLATLGPSGAYINDPGTAPTTADLYVGNRYNTAFGLTGDLAELIVYDRVLTTEERNQVGGYLETKYGLETSYGPCEYRSRVLGDGPEAYWRLNETSPANTAADETGNGHHQALGSGVGGPGNFTRSGSPPDVGPRPSDLVNGQALGGFEPDNNAPTGYNGVTPGWGGDKYTLAVGGAGGPAVVVSDSVYTVETRIQPLQVPDVLGYVFHRRDFDDSGPFGDALGFRGPYNDPGADTDRTLFFFDGTNVVEGTTPTVLDLDQWYHVAFVRDGSDVLVYLNGELEIATTSTAPVPGAFDQGTWVFGGRSNHQGLKFPGNIDEIAIYDGALSQSDVRGHFLAALVPEPSSIVLSLLALVGFVVVARRRKK
ncbi:MAG TPA: LamG-like jellyroll fold domain-containing protein [Phycisphaerae bacterium]|nr:LamG-like jellyroll fold domain-containing protein [Phycisphaerae bacterium]